MKKITGLILAGFILVSPNSYLIGGDNITQISESQAKATLLYEKGDLLKRSAEKSRKAAVTLQAQAEKNRRIASDLENAVVSPNNDRTSDHRAAGSYLIQAGDLEVSAARNYSIAYSNSIGAVTIFREFKEKDLERLEKLVKTDNENIDKSYSRALDDYSAAENNYSEFYGDDLEKQAVANEKSAKCLENMAKRK